MKGYVPYPEEIEIERRTEITDEEVKAAEAHALRIFLETGEDSEEFKRAARIRSSLFWRRFALKNIERKSEDEDNTDYEELDRITGVKR